MILYYTPGGCSQSVHIAMIEAGLEPQIVRVGRDKRTEDGRDFLTINPTGFTPALDLGDGTILTENLAILAYVGERQGGLLLAEGLGRWRALESTSFMTTEIHGNFRPFFHLAEAGLEKDRARANLVRHFATMAARLGDTAFLGGERMSIADPFLFVMLSWAAMFDIEVPAQLGAYFKRMKALPSVERALIREGPARPA